MTVHTPGPWSVERHATKYPDLFTYSVLAPNEDAGKTGVSYSGQYLSVAAGLDSADDAAFIVRACNSHADLLAALQDLFFVSYVHPPCVGHERCQGKGDPCMVRAVAQARAAIAQATGEQP